MANPQEGSKKRVEKAENDPATGKVTTSSPSACIVQNWMMPVIMYARSIEAGPLLNSAKPEATKRPVPVAVVSPTHGHEICKACQLSPQSQSSVDAALSIHVQAQYLPFWH